MRCYRNFLAQGTCLNCSEKTRLSFWWWRNGCADRGFSQARHYWNELHSFSGQFPEGNVSSGEYGTMRMGQGKGKNMPVRFYHSTRYQSVLRNNSPVNGPATGYLCRTDKRTHSYSTQPCTNFRQTRRWNGERDVTVMDGASEGSHQALRTLQITARTPEKQLLITPQTNQHSSF